MKNLEVNFLGSFEKVSQCPNHGKPEFALVGRSNVGKSSLINFLLNKKDVARVSGTPGKTQTVNIFEIDKEWVLADLPGYGYAKVSKRKREDWGKLIRKYLKDREELFCVLQLVDSRIEPQIIDLDFINWMGELGLPFAIVFTKADKKNSPDTLKNIHLFKQELKKSWEEIPPIFVTSASKQIGKEELFAFVQSYVKNGSE
jgi:GTP-binding protein